MKNLNNVLRVHGIVLLILGSVMSTQTLLGRFKGIGALAFVKGDVLRSVGLFEAYLLAALFGIVLLLLSGKYYEKKWHLLAASIHAILFTTNIMFWGAYAMAGIVTIGYVSTIAHALLIAIESTCYFLQKARGTKTE